MPKSVNVTPRPSVTVDVTTGPPGPQGPPGPPGSGGGGTGVAGSIRLTMPGFPQLLLDTPPGYVPTDGPIVNQDNVWASLSQVSVSGDGLSFDPDTNELTYTADGLYMYSLYYQVVQNPAGVNPSVMMAHNLSDNQWLSLHANSATMSISGMVSWFGEQSAGDTNAWFFDFILGHQQVHLNKFNLSIIRLG